MPEKTYRATQTEMTCGEANAAPLVTPVTTTPAGRLQSEAPEGAAVVAGTDHQSTGRGACQVAVACAAGETCAAEASAEEACVAEAFGAEACAVCLEDYVSGDRLRVLPCLHEFHALCIDEWLTTRQPLCPVCKRDARTKHPYTTNTTITSSSSSSTSTTTTSTISDHLPASDHASISIPAASSAAAPSSLAVTHPATGAGNHPSSNPLLSSYSDPYVTSPSTQAVPGACDAGATAEPYRSNNDLAAPARHGVGNKGQDGCASGVVQTALTVTRQQSECTSLGIENARLH